MPGFHLTTQRRLTAKKLGALIALIEREGKNVEDITHTGAADGYWFGTYPLPPLPLWDSVVLDCIRSFHNGFLPVGFAEKVDTRFFQRAMNVLWPHGNLHFDIPFQYPDSNLEGLELNLSVENKDVFLGFRHHPTWDEKDYPATLRSMEEMIRLLDLPLAIEVKEKLGYLRHTSKGGVIFRPRDGVDVPNFSSLQGNLPGLSLEEFVSKYRKILKTPGLKASDGIWHSGWPPKCPNQENPLKYYNDFNGLGLPGKNVECTFTWHLKNYTLFRDIARMAEYTEHSSAGQKLLRFDWEGRPCEFRAVSGRDESFKLYFEFKEPNDSVPLERALEEKLKIRLNEPPVW